MRRKKSRVSEALVPSGHAKASTSGAHAPPSSSSGKRQVLPTNASPSPSSCRRQISPIQALDVPESSVIPEASPTTDIVNAFEPVSPHIVDIADASELVSPPTVDVVELCHLWMLSQKHLEETL